MSTKRCFSILAFIAQMTTAIQLLLNFMCILLFLTVRCKFSNFANIINITPLN